MGVVKNVGFDHFPKQGTWLGKRARVCFRYDTANCIGATIVRDDSQEPFVTILQLDDGRYVLSSECQHTVDD
jgi:hypothetical protein